MSTDRRGIVLFDLFGVIARHQRPGALGKLAARCHSSLDAFTTAYWAHRPPYAAGRHTASAYWTDVLHALSRPVDPDMITASAPCGPPPPASSSSTTARRTCARRKPSA